MAFPCEGPPDPGLRAWIPSADEEPSTPSIELLDYAAGLLLQMCKDSGIKCSRKDCLAGEIHRAGPNCAT